MKYRIPTYTCAAIVAVAGTFTATFAQADDKASMPDPAEMMKRFEEAGTPGKAHRGLEPLVGEWTAEVKSWMAPGSEPVVSKGTAKAEWFLKGRFVREEFTGDMMGQPFEGVSLVGYDNQKKKYVNSWVDDMSTAIFTAEGTSDD